MKKEVYEIREASEEYGIPYSRIYNGVRSKELEAKKVVGKWYVTKEALDEWLGIKPSNDEITELKLENQQLQMKIKAYESQYRVIKELLQTLNGTCNVL